MGDRSGPGQHRGDDDERGDHAPRHLPASPPPGTYDLGYGAHTAGGRNGTAVHPSPPPTSPPAPPPPPPRDPAVGAARSAAEVDTGQMPILPGPPAMPAPAGRGPGPVGPGVGGLPPVLGEGPVLGPVAPGGPDRFAVGLDRPELGRRIPVHAQDWPVPSDGVTPSRPVHAYDTGYDYDPGYDAIGGDDDDSDRGVSGTVRGVAAEAAWRYRSAPLGVRIVADIAAASLVLLLIVVGALALRQDGGPERATAGTRPQPATTASTTTTTAAPTTTAPTTTTTAPTTTTTAPPTTTTTEAAPVVPPPTEAPTTTLPPTTTTTEAVDHRSCRSAWSAGALPLFAGDPGYSERLDSDRDGEACDEFEDWGGGRD